MAFKLVISQLEELVRVAKSPELIENIQSMQGKILFNPKTKKFHPLLIYRLTWIGNVAKEAGDEKVTQMAREMRDEFKVYCDDKVYDRDVYVVWEE